MYGQRHDIETSMILSIPSLVRNRLDRPDGYVLVGFTRHGTNLYFIFV
jgi:hypothetical protein